MKLGTKGTVNGIVRSTGVPNGQLTVKMPTSKWPSVAAKSTPGIGKGNPAMDLCGSLVHERSGGMKVPNC